MVDHRLVFALFGMGLHGIILALILTAVLLYDSQVYAWSVFLHCQHATLALWVLLSLVALATSKDRDVYYMYGSSFLVSLLFNWFS